MDAELRDLPSVEHLLHQIREPMTRQHNPSFCDWRHLFRIVVSVNEAAARGRDATIREYAGRAACHIEQRLQAAAMQAKVKWKRALPSNPRRSQIRPRRRSDFLLLLGKPRIVLRPEILHELHSRNALIEEGHNIKEHIKLRAAEFLYIWFVERQRLRHGGVRDRWPIQQLLDCNRELYLCFEDIRVFAKRPAVMLLAANPPPVLTAHVLQQQAGELVTLAAMVSDSPAVPKFEYADELAISFSLSIPSRFVPHELKLPSRNAKRPGAALGVGKHELAVVSSRAGFRRKPVGKRNRAGWGLLAAFPSPAHGTRFFTKDGLRPKPVKVSTQRNRREVNQGMVGTWRARSPRRPPTVSGVSC